MKFDIDEITKQAIKLKNTGPKNYRLEEKKAIWKAIGEHIKSQGIKPELVDERIKSDTYAKVKELLLIYEKEKKEIKKSKGMLDHMEDAIIEGAIMNELMHKKREGN